MPKKSIINLGVDLRCRCLKVFPPPDAEAYRDLATLRFRLNREQAYQLARALLAATQDWEEVEVVVHRFERRPRDGAFLVSVLPEFHELSDPEFVKKIKHPAPKELDIPAEMEEVLESLKDQPFSD